MRRGIGRTGRRLLGAAGGEGERDYLLDYADGTFTRASVATWPDLPTSIPEYASGEARILTPSGDYATDGARTNAISGDSSRLDSAAWTLALSATVASEAVASLFDSESADTLTFAAGADSGNHTPLLGTADGETYTASIVARTASGTKAFRLRIIGRDGVVNTSSDMTATTDGQTFQYTAALGTGATTPEIRIVNAAAGGIGTITIDHAQCEKAAFASSPIRSTDGVAVTRASEGNLIPQASIDSRFWGGFSMDITLMSASTNPGYMGVLHTASGGTVMLYGNRLRVAGADSVIHYSAYASWSVGDTVTIRWDVASGDFSLATPAGVYSGVGATSAFSLGDVYAGSYSGGSTSGTMFGRMTRPVAL